MFLQWIVPDISFCNLTYSWKDLPHYKRLSMPFIYMIYMCISLSPAKDPSNWTITNLRLIKGFFRVPPLCQSYESYELVQWAFYLLFGIAAKHSSNFKSISVRLLHSFCLLSQIFASLTFANNISYLSLANAKMTFILIQLYIVKSNHSTAMTASCSWPHDFYDLSNKQGKLYRQHNYRQSPP